MSCLPKANRQKRGQHKRLIMREDPAITQEDPAITQDVLRIKMTGPVELHLTVVDLPRLLSVANEEQTEMDVQVLENMVDSYLKNSQMIILAVVQANNAIANQGIIQKSRRFDPAGERTMGIFTKPDLINKGTEKRITRLAQKSDTTKFRLDFFVVRNPLISQLASAITAKQRLAIKDQHSQVLTMERRGSKYGWRGSCIS